MEVKKSRFIKNHEAKGLLSNLGIKTPLSKVPIIQNLRKQEIQAIFTKMNLIRLVFNMIWHIEILKI